jgi:hypothetical protein
MFSDILLKTFKFLRILYSFYKLLVIFKVKKKLFYGIWVSHFKKKWKLENHVLGKTMENYPIGKICPLKSSMV